MIDMTPEQVAVVMARGPAIYHYAVRWQYRRHLGLDGFYDKLLQVIAHADDDNRLLLARGFPEAVMAVTHWQSQPGFPEEIAAWADAELAKAQP